MPDPDSAVPASAGKLTKLLFVVLAAAAAARFVVVLNLPIQLLPNASYDDGRFMRLGPIWHREIGSAHSTNSPS